MKYSLAILLLVALFLIGTHYLDERRVSFSALPVRAHATSATVSPERSALAIDERPGTEWIVASGTNARWTVSFDPPQKLIGVSIDAGSHERRDVHAFDVKLFGLKGAARPLTKNKNDRALARWHLYRRAKPVVARSLEISIPIRGKKPSESWGLRDVRFLVDDAWGRIEDEPDNRDATPGFVLEALIPFLCGVIWLAIMFRFARAGDCE